MPPLQLSDSLGNKPHTLPHRPSLKTGTSTAFALETVHCPIVALAHWMVSLDLRLGLAEDWRSPAR